MFLVLSLYTTRFYFGIVIVVVAAAAAATATATVVSFRPAHVSTRDMTASVEGAVW